MYWAWHIAKVIAEFVIDEVIEMVKDYEKLAITIICHISEVSIRYKGCDENGIINLNSQS